MPLGRSGPIHFDTVPVLSGSGAFESFVNGGDTVLEPAVVPVLLVPIGDKWLVESRVEFEGEFEHKPDGSFRGPVNTDEVRDYVTKACLDMKSLFCQSYGVVRAKHELAKHMTQLVLTPKETPKGWQYEVESDWEPLPNQKSVILMVARDGIERNNTLLKFPLALVLRP